MVNVGNGIWPPPPVRYMIRSLAFALSTGAAVTAFAGFGAVAGSLAAVAAAMLLVDIIGGK